MARGRNSLTPEQRLAKKESKAAQREEALIAGATARIPEDKDRRQELRDELREAVIESRNAASIVSEQKKRMKKVFGIFPETLAILKIMEKTSRGYFDAVMAQVQIFAKDDDRPLQLSLDLQIGKGVAPDEAVGQASFDRTGSGSRIAAERSDDPAKAMKTATEIAAPKPSTETMPLAEFEAKLLANNTAAAERAAQAKPEPEPSQEATGAAEQTTSPDAAEAAASPPAAAPKRPGPPPAPKKAKPNLDDFERDIRQRARIKDEAAAKEEAAAASPKAKSEAKLRAEMRQKADKYFPPQDGKGLGPDGIH